MSSLKILVGEFHQGINSQLSFTSTTHSRSSITQALLQIAIKMRFAYTFILAAVCCIAVVVSADDVPKEQLQALPVLETLPQEEGAGLVRDKRTLFLKKKLLGAGLLGFGLGIAKGYKAGYHSAPEVHHVYLSPPSPPPVKYVEYVEKPVFVERIVEKPVHVEYEPAWSQPAPAYGPW